MTHSTASHLLFRYSEFDNDILSRGQSDTVVKKLCPLGLLIVENLKLTVAYSSDGVLKTFLLDLVSGKTGSHLGRHIFRENVYFLVLYHYL